MEELYELIEQRIKEAGYEAEVSGRDIYNDLCDQMDEQEEGTYLLLSKPSDTVTYEYNVTILSDNFDLHTMTIREKDGNEYVVNFD